MKLTREDLTMMLDEMDKTHVDKIDINVWYKTTDLFFHVDFSVGNINSQSKYDAFKILKSEKLPKPY